MLYETYSTQISDFIAVVVPTRKGQMYLPPDAITTSKVAIFVNDLFDSFNGAKGKGLSSVISNTSNHIQYWREVHNNLRKMVYVTKNSHEAIPPGKSAKCLTYWIWTIENCIYLWNILEPLGFSYLNLRHLNQDVLENFFGQIRDHGHRNVNPSPFQFEAAYKILLNTNLTSKHSISSNCQKNKEGKSLSSLLKLNDVNDSKKNVT